MVAALPVAVFLCLVTTLFDSEIVRADRQRVEFGWPRGWVAQYQEGSPSGRPHRTGLTAPKPPPYGTDILALDFLADALFWYALIVGAACGGLYLMERAEPSGVPPQHRL